MTAGFVVVLEGRPVFGPVGGEHGEGWVDEPQVSDGVAWTTTPAPRSPLQFDFPLDRRWDLRGVIQSEVNTALTENVGGLLLAQFRGNGKEATKEVVDRALASMAVRNAIADAIRAHIVQLPTDAIREISRLVHDVGDAQVWVEIEGVE